MDSSGEAYLGGQVNGIDLFIYRTHEEMGDYTCAFQNSLRDSGSYETEKFKGGKKNFYAFEIDKMNDTFLMIYDMEVNGVVRWINRTD